MTKGGDGKEKNWNSSRSKLLVHCMKMASDYRTPIFLWKMWKYDNESVVQRYLV